MTEYLNNPSTSNKWNNLILHLHPKNVPEKALKYTLTWGLGGMSALLFVLLTLTGMLLKFSYIPTIEHAYDSILHIKNEVVFGMLIRNMHHWCGTLLVLITFLHMLRVFLTGAYYHKRGTNWIIGVAMLLLVFFSNFTGYLLPWDQLAYWAVTVITSMLDYIPFLGKYIGQFVLQGTEVGAPTLLFFYNMHTGILPISMVILMMFHFWKVRKAGGVVIPVDKNEEAPKKVPVLPNLVVREFVVALCLIAFILLISTFLNAPFGERANPSVTPNPTKAPWYFMGFQELILHFHPLLAVVIIPMSILFLMFYLPSIKNINPPEGIWFLSPAGKRLALYASVSAFIFSGIFILLDEYLLNTNSVFKHGIVYFILFIIFVFGGSLFIKMRFQANKAERIQTIGVFIISSFIVLSITGIYLRGAGMHLIF